MGSKREFMKCKEEEMSKLAFSGILAIFDPQNREDGSRFAENFKLLIGARQLCDQLQPGLVQQDLE